MPTIIVSAPTEATKYDYNELFISEKDEALEPPPSYTLMANSILPMFNLLEGENRAYNGLEGKIEMYADDYGASYYQMKETIRCESNFRHEGIFGDSGKSFGIAQWHYDSFEEMKPYSWMDYESKDNQIEAMAYAFSAGKQCHWTCWRLRFDSNNDYCGLLGYKPL